MPETLVHPYRQGEDPWVRGSFHGHCQENSRCATVPLAESVRRYQRIGAGFVTLTDHDAITDLESMRRAYPDIVFLEGFEYSSCENLAFVGEKVPPLYSLPLGEALHCAGEDLLTMVCHPQPRTSGSEYWTLAKLEALGSWPDGIEVYNGHYGIATALAAGRQPLGTALWDEVLTSGRRLWGFANDDFHDPDDLGNAWNMVQTTAMTPGAIVTSARAGRCYATTGLLLRSFSFERGRFCLEVDGEARGAFIGPQGKPLSCAVGTRFEYQTRDEAYVRFEAEGQIGRLFLQPAFAASPQS